MLTAVLTAKIEWRNATHQRENVAIAVTSIAIWLTLINEMWGREIFVCSLERCRIKWKTFIHQIVKVACGVGLMMKNINTAQHRTNVMCTLKHHYQGKVEEIQPDLTDIIADSFNFQYTLVGLMLHQCGKFRRYEVCDVVVYLAATRRLDCKLKINSDSALLSKLLNCHSCKLILHQV